MTSEEKAKQLGFEICEWKPEPQDKCESCGKEQVQMWFASDGFGEGCYWCLDCIVEMYEENERTVREMNDIEKQGHHPHCAARQVFGDGECECNLYAKGYDPYAWQKAALER